MSDRLRVAVVGASGYAGGEFLRLALGHPLLEPTQVTSERNAGLPVHLVHPNLRGVSRLRFRSVDELEPADVLVLALPHGEAAGRLERFTGLAPVIVDLSSDFRFADAGAYERAYGSPHPRPSELGTFVAAIPELYRGRLRGARRISGAGCIATAAILALHPLLRAGLSTRRDVVVEAKIGSSAAGHSPGLASHHPERSGAVRTYAPVRHRHTGEIEDALGGSLRVHLTATAVERVRGVLVTGHLFIPDGTSERDVAAAFNDAYEEEPYVRIVAARKGVYRVPDPRILDGTNWCDVGFELDRESGRVVVMSALDNLVKGTAGHALQSLNIALGWDERLGLEFFGLHP